MCLCRSVCTLIISTAVPRFFKCSWLLKLISHDIHFIIIVVLGIYKYTDFCCMEKVGKVPPTVTAELPIKPFATVCESQQWDLVTPPWFCNEHFFVENCSIHKRLHKRHNLQCYLIWISWGSIFFAICFTWEQCARGQIILKMLLNMRGTASIVFLVLLKIIK